MILNEPDLFSKCDFSSVHLAFSGASTLSEETEQAFLRKTGIRSFKQGLGMTEAGVLSVTPRFNGKGGSVGIPLPQTEVKVIDAKGMKVKPNQPGELCFRGPQIMKGETA